MSLMEDTIIYQVSDAHEDMIIALRSEMNIKKNKLNVNHSLPIQY